MLSASQRSPRPAQVCSLIKLALPHKLPPRLRTSQESVCVTLEGSGVSVLRFASRDTARRAKAWCACVCCGAFVSD